MRLFFVRLRKYERFTINYLNERIAENHTCLFVAARGYLRENN